MKVATGMSVFVVLVLISSQADAGLVFPDETHVTEYGLTQGTAGLDSPMTGHLWAAVGSGAVRPDPNYLRYLCLRELFHEELESIGCDIDLLKRYLDKMEHEYKIASEVFQGNDAITAELTIAQLLDRGSYRYKKAETDIKNRNNKIRLVTTGFLCLAIFTFCVLFLNGNSKVKLVATGFLCLAIITFCVF